MVDQAEIHRMAWSEYNEDQEKAATQLQDNFVSLKDKELAWNDLIHLFYINESDKHWDIGKALGSAFQYVLNKNEAWEDLRGFIQSSEIYMRCDAAIALGIAFPHAPDKNEAWEDLYGMIMDNAEYVRSGAAYAIGDAFPYVPNKNEAWKALENLMMDQYVDVQTDAVYSLGKVFLYVPDKKQAWKDLCWLAHYPHPDLQWRVLQAIRLISIYVPDKNRAWYDLIRLAECSEISFNSYAVEALGLVFPHVADKNEAWENLHQFIHHKEIIMRYHAVKALSYAFLQLPNKKLACADLNNLTNDDDDRVRSIANYTLGKVTILMAEGIEDEDFKKELERAIRYFEKASKEATYDNPAKFCLPFYRSFHALAFKKEKTEAEVQRYLSEAKNAVSGSGSKKNLLEAIETLGNALKELQKAKDIKNMKSDLNAYRRYCHRTCELLDTIEEKAPGASKMIRRGLPIIDERIKGIITEMQEKAKALCKQTKGTTFEDLGKDVYRIGKNLLVSNPAILEKRLNNLQISLSAICAGTSDINVGEACELLKRANDESILENRIQLMDDAISKILPHLGNMTNIQISNSNNVQITTANGTIQKMSIEIPEENKLK